MIIKEMDANLRPREKALHSGIESLSDQELLAVIIRCGYRDYSAIEMANDILKETGGLKGLLSLSVNQIMEIKGIKLAKAMEIMASIELVRRINYQKVIEEGNSVDEVIEWLKCEIGVAIKECLVVIFLNIKNDVIGYEKLNCGTINSIAIEIRELAQMAIRHNSAKIIIAHNHPSGDIKPSHDDIVTTHRIARAMNLIGIPLVDHLIISSNDYYSFASDGSL